MAKKSTGEKKTKLQKFGLFFYERPVFTVILWLVVVFMGALSYTTLMRREGFPAINASYGFIRVVDFGQSAEKVDSSYSQPLVEAAKQDPNHKTISSTASDQGASVQIAFKDGTDVAASLDTIKQRVKGKIPASGKVVYVKFEGGKITTEGDDILISVYGKNLTPAQLDAKAAKIAAILDDKMTLANRVRVDKLVEQTVNPITGQPVSGQVHFNRFYGEGSSEALPAGLVAIRAKDGTDQLKLYDEVQKILDSDEVQNLGVQTNISSNFAQGIREQLASLQKNLFEGLLIVMLVSFVLISWRASIVTAIAMTTTVAITVGVLNVIGYTINTITLFSLILCLALIVDDTTIIVEAIEAGLQKGRDIHEVVSESLRKVARASFTGTLTTVLAFAPMLFIGGILGKFIRAIPVTIIISLLVSLLVSFIFIPLMVRYTMGRKTKLGKSRDFNPVSKLEQNISSGLGNTLRWSAKKKWRSIVMRTGAVLISFVVLGAAMMTASKVGFDIFPSPKDGNDITLSLVVANKETANIENTEAITDRVLATTRDVLGDNARVITLSGQQGPPTREGFAADIKLTDMSKRTVTSVELAKQLQAAIEKNEKDVIVVASAAGVGPPAGGFAVQISDKSGSRAEALAQDMKAYLSTLTLTRPDKTTATLKDVAVTPSTTVVRGDNGRIITVNAGFKDKDTTTLVTLSQSAVEKQFNDKLASYGLSKADVKYDFGQEDENQDSFSSMGKAALPLFVAIFVLMAILFRSLLQPLLIFSSLPFAFFGVVNGLHYTDNPISFFSMLGVFALIGIGLNNTILLTDYANQERKAGKEPVEAMAIAIQARLRPLLTTSITSVLALLPLALSDPFWEGLAFTLIFGLLSSTFLVILLFPYFYVIVEAIRALPRRIFRKLRRQTA